MNVSPEDNVWAVPPLTVYVIKVELAGARSNVLPFTFILTPVKPSIPSTVPVIEIVLPTYTVLPLFTFGLNDNLTTLYTNVLLISPYAAVTVTFPDAFGV